MVCNIATVAGVKDVSNQRGQLSSMSFWNGRPAKNRGIIMNFYYELPIVRMRESIPSLSSPEGAIAVFRWRIFARYYAGFVFKHALCAWFC
jgi:hypothetical protein